MQRWLKFVKYLKRKGWEPVVYTVENGEYPALDYSLEKEIPKDVTVIKKKIWEPYSAYKFLSGRKKKDEITITNVQQNKKISVGNRISKWIRANLFVPDPRVFWVKPSVKFLENYLKQNKIDCIITSGPPHSLHLIGMKLKEKTGVKWIADFRDPWRTNYFLQQLGMSKSTWKKQLALEKKVVDGADKIIVVTRTMKEEFEEMARGKVEIITNGYDEEDFSSSSVVGRETNNTMETNNKFSIVFTGTFVNSQNPELLWKVLDEKVNAEENFKNELEIKLTGTIGDAVRKSLEENNLLAFTTFKNYLPHNEIVIEQQNAQVLLLSVNNTPNAKLILTGKLFEYLASGRPILCFCPPDGDAGEIINECKAGYVLNYTDKEKIKTAIAHLFTNFKNQNLPTRKTGFEKYSREKLTERLMEVVGEVVNKI